MRHWTRHDPALLYMTVMCDVQGPRLSLMAQQMHAAATAPSALPQQVHGYLLGSVRCCPACPHTNVSIHAAAHSVIRSASSSLHATSSLQPVMHLGV